MFEIKPRLVGSCAIVVGDLELTPGASHLFALLLAFALVPREPWTRRQLQALLFDDADERQAAHRLRQLLYRLRSFGVVLQESSTGSIRLGNPVADLLGDGDDGPHVPAHGTMSVAEPLGLYTPRLPAAYLAWLDQRRDALRSLHTARRMSWLRAARERQDWALCARLVSELLPAEALNDEVIVVGAEAYAMLGLRDRALDIIDQHVRDVGEPLEARPSLKRLRARILSTRVPRREGTLRGREDCLAFLREQWELSTSGDGGRACAILGPPGMGKTRVGETFSATVRLMGGQVIQHRCDGQARQFPLSLFSQLVPDLRRRRGSIGADPALSGVLDHLAPGPIAPPADVVSPEARRGEVKRAIVDLLEAVSAEQPMLVVVDDAHLLDDASRAVIRGMVESSNAAHVLFVLLCRPRPDTQSLLSASTRFAAYTLAPLSEEDSRALVLELSANRPPTQEELAWAVSQAAGNAFYLHALAHHPCNNVSLPAHVTSLAESSYLGVSSEARTVLDACLLLDTLATPARVAQVAGIEPSTLIAAVRELEASDLLRYHDGLFAGPHAIVRDVLDGLMPSTSRALLQHRIAELLSAECADPVRARAVGWAAVSAWLACGEPVAAVELALRVARDVSTVGEPEAGAVLLSRLPRASLTLEIERRVLDETIALADAGKSLSLLTSAQRERAQLALRAGEGATAVASFTLRAIAGETMQGRMHNISAVQGILTNGDVSPELRADAAARSIAVADLNLDQELADASYAELRSLATAAHLEGGHLLRAQLVYHTTFGNVATAHSIVRELRANAPTPALEHETRSSLSYCACALLKIGRYGESAALSIMAFRAMMTEQHFSSAEYFGSIAADAYVCMGEFGRARDIYSELRLSETRRKQNELGLGSGLAAVGICLSLLDGRYDEASRLISSALATPLGQQSPRIRSVFLSHRIRCAELMAHNTCQSADVAELKLIYQRGCRMGGQDGVVEALWAAANAVGDQPGAHELLKGYFNIRRENGLAEASLRRTTLADPYWRTPT